VIDPAAIKRAALIRGDCVEVMAAMPADSVDAVVCDPPYGLEFMGKEWDCLDTRQPGDATFTDADNPYGRSKVRYSSAPSYGGSVGPAQQAWHYRWAVEALRVLKPGGHLVAFGGTRTYHRLVCALEDAGFEIRDSLHWMYGCLSEDTEVLTRRGWLRHATLTGDDDVKQWNAETGGLTWVRPDAIHRYPFDGELVALHCQGDAEPWQLITPNHRVYCQGGGLPSGFWSVREAGRLDGSFRVPDYSGAGVRVLRGPDVPYTGTVWCVTVPAGAFVVRRGGHPFLTGNSGFPKSHNVGKAIDKAAGAEREVIGKHPSPAENKAGGVAYRMSALGMPTEAAPATEAAKQWEGWGTALKPTHEIASLFQKPWTTAALLDTMGSCLSSLSAAIAALPSPGHLPVLPEGKASSAPAPAATPGASTPLGTQTPTGVEVGSSAVTATSQFTKAKATSLNTVSSWQRTLDVLSEPRSTFTIETATDLTTDLKTLKSCLSPITPANMLQAAMNPDGSTAPVSSAVSAFVAVASKWIGILTLSALDLATSLEPHERREEDGSHAHEPIVLARKPLTGAVATNVLKHGTGALNIDGCRVGVGLPVPGGGNGKANHGGRIGGAGGTCGVRPKVEAHTAGRWPPNVLLTHDARCRCTDTIRKKTGSGFVSDDTGRKAPGGQLGIFGHADYGGQKMTCYVDEDGTEPVEVWECVEGCPVAALDAQSGTLTPGHHPKTRGKGSETCGPSGHAGQNDLAERLEKAGGASRFYPQLNWDPEYDAPFLYQAKPAKSERELGRPDDFNGKRWNKHPTVKPVALMRWLVRLVAGMPGAVVLDPFMGSGTTGCACVEEGARFVGIEQDPASFKIATARMRHVKDLKDG